MALSVPMILKLALRHLAYRHRLISVPTHQIFVENLLVLGFAS